MNDIAYSTVTQKDHNTKLVVVSGILQLLKKMLRTSRNHLVLHPWNLQQQETLFLIQMILSSSLVRSTTLKRLSSSKLFYPTFITGLSGNGKTFGVEQACAQLKRELIRVNITIETDEDDLIGGFRLVNGETVWHNGPVIEALERGAILLLDEIDLASNKILCLQSILEGTGVFLKKIGRTVRPPQDSTSLPPQILKVRVQTTEDLLELTCSMKHSSKDSQLPSSNPIQNPQ